MESKLIHRFVARLAHALDWVHRGQVALIAVLTGVTVVGGALGLRTAGVAIAQHEREAALASRLHEQTVDAEYHERIAEEAERKRPPESSEQDRLDATKSWESAYRERPDDEYAVRAGSDLLRLSENRAARHDWTGAVVAVGEAREQFRLVRDDTRSRGLLRDCNKQEGVIERQAGHLTQARAKLYKAVQDCEGAVADCEGRGVPCGCEYAEAFAAYTELIAAEPGLLTPGLVNKLVTYSDKMAPGCVADMTGAQAGTLARQLMDRVTLNKVGVSVAAGAGDQPAAPRLFGTAPGSTAPAQVAVFGDPGTRNATVLGGDWAVAQDEVIQSGVANERALIGFGNIKQKDYDVLCEAMAVQGSQGFSIAVCCSDDMKTLREFAVGSYHNKGHELYRFVGGKWERGPSMYREGSIEFGRWYTVQVQVRGSLVTCLLDGVQMFREDDPRFAGGKMGLGCYAGSVRFRGIRVTSPNGEVLWEGAPNIEEAASSVKAIDRKKVPPGVLPAVSSATG